MSKIDDILKEQATTKDDSPKKNYSDKEIRAEYQVVQFCNAQGRHGVQYIHLRPLDYMESEDVILCAGNGYKFAIQGKNMILLFEMMCARAISRIKEGEKVEIAEIVISIESVIVEPLGENDE